MTQTSPHVYVINGGRRYWCLETPRNQGERVDGGLGVSDKGETMVETTKRPPAVRKHRCSEGLASSQGEPTNART